MLAVILGWVLWHSSVSVTPTGEAWSPVRQEARVETVRACHAARDQHIAALRRRHPDTAPVASPPGVIVRHGTRATVHLFHCLPAHTRLD